MGLHYLNREGPPASDSPEYYRAPAISAARLREATREVMHAADDKHDELLP
jgi:hypothetical protein